MITCPFCKELIPDDSWFCDQCGQELSFCPRCNEPRKGRCCTKCGSQLVLATALFGGTGNNNASATTNQQQTQQPPKAQTPKKPQQPSAPVADSKPQTQTKASDSESQNFSIDDIMDAFANMDLFGSPSAKPKQQPTQQQQPKQQRQPQADPSTFMPPTSVADQNSGYAQGNTVNSSAQTKAYDDKGPKSTFGNFPLTYDARIWNDHIDNDLEDFLHISILLEEVQKSSVAEYRLWSTKANQGVREYMLRKAVWELNPANWQTLRTTSPERFIQNAYQTLVELTDKEDIFQVAAYQILGDIFSMPIYHSIDFNKALKWYLAAANSPMHNLLGDPTQTQLHCQKRAAMIARYLQDKNTLQKMANKLDKYGSHDGNIEYCEYLSNVDQDEEEYDRVFDLIYNANDADCDFFVIRNTIPKINDENSTLAVNKSTHDSIETIFKYDEGWYSDHVKDQKSWIGANNNSWPTESYDRMALYWFYQYMKDPNTFFGSNMYKALKYGIEKGSLWCMYYMGVIALDNMRGHKRVNNKQYADQAGTLALKHLRRAVDNGMLNGLSELIALLEETDDPTHLIEEYEEVESCGTF